MYKFFPDTKTYNRGGKIIIIIFSMQIFSNIVECYIEHGLNANTNHETPITIVEWGLEFYKKNGKKEFN